MGRIPLLVVLLLFLAAAERSAQAEVLLSAKLTLTSPAPNVWYNSPVIPITLNIVTTPTSSAAKQSDVIDFALYDGDPASKNSDHRLDSEVLERLLPSVQLKLCFHVKGERGYACTSSYVDKLEQTAGSLFRLSRRRHTVFAWLMRIGEGEESSGGGLEHEQFVYSSRCAYEDMEDGTCEPSLISKDGTVEAYCSSTFFVGTESECALTGANCTRRGSTKGGAELTKTARNPGPPSSQTKEGRTKYFDAIYDSEVWAFPDWHASNAGEGVKSGFGSTLHQTEDIRPHLDLIIPQLNIKGILDVPCGDMNWITHVGAVRGGDVCYFGGDVSGLVVRENRKR